MRRRRVLGALVGALAVITVVVVAWPRSSSGHSGTPVRLSNFKIAGPDIVRAGATTFLAVGNGPSMHELNIAETSLGAKDLPTTPDGTVDDQTDRPDFRHVAEAEGLDIGDEKTLTVDLAPGTYVMYCNMDGHYEAGMVKTFEVTP